MIPSGSLPSPNQTMPAFWWSFQASGVLTLRLCGQSLYHHSPSLQESPQPVLFLNCRLSSQPPQVLGSLAPLPGLPPAHGLSCSLLCLGLQIYSHACFYFLKVCQAGAHRYSPVPLAHPSGLLGMVLSCHFQGGWRGEESKRVLRLPLDT